MPRKGENIRKRKDGRWEARYSITTENGETKYKSVYADTYLEVKRKRLNVLKSIETSISTPPNFRMRELATEWLHNVKLSVKESSYTRYHRVILHYILPYFELREIKIINIDAINTFKKDLSNGCEITTKPLSPKTISDIMSVLKLFLLFCEKDGFVCPDFSKTISIKHDRKDYKILSTEARIKVESMLWNGESELELGILLALYTGLRIGELCALRWHDINLVEGTISISRTLERIADLDSSSANKTKIVIGSPKTSSSKRIIPLPNYILQHLCKFKNEDNYYLLTSSVNPTEPHNFYLRYKRIMNKCGIEDITFHALRHTFATQCVELGFDTKALSEILGHSSVTTTLKCYVHPTMKAKKAQMDMLNPDNICGQKSG